jgi:hypothetical protein
MFWPPTPWPLPPVGGWRLGVDRVRGHTRVTVDTPLWKARERTFRVYSSALEGRGLVEEEWAPGVARTVARRLKENHGGEKGRVLYAGRSTSGTDRAPLAVLAWHLPEDEAPLAVLDLDVAGAVREQRPDLVIPLARSLLALLRTVASHPDVARKPDRLGWVTDDESVARRAYEEWGFKGIKKTARPDHVTSRFYLRRIES